MKYIDDVFEQTENKKKREILQAEGHNRTEEKLCHAELSESSMD